MLTFAHLPATRQRCSHLPCNWSSFARSRSWAVSFAIFWGSVSYGIRMVMIAWNNMSIPTGVACSGGRHRTAADDRVEQDDAILRRRLLVLASHQLVVDYDARSIGLGARVNRA